MCNFPKIRTSILAEQFAKIYFKWDIYEYYGVIKSPSDQQHKIFGKKIEEYPHISHPNVIPERVYSTGSSYGKASSLTIYINQVWFR